MAVGNASLSISSQLKEKNAEYKGSNAIGGQIWMTFPNMIHGMRVNMNTSHQKQAVNLLNPDHPFVATGMENLVGKYSSGYKKVTEDLRVVKKIVKFTDEVDEPIIYKLFVYDEKNDTYDVIHRGPMERLTEKFGFEYNNDVIDSYEEDDLIEKDTIIYKSRSYDDYMNYGYGMNVTTMYSLDPYTTEDAAVCSESLSNAMLSIEADEVEMSLNDNDFLLNLYGDKDSYIPLPKIGQMIKTGPVVAWRRLITDQMLYDFRASGLMEIRRGDTVKSVDGVYQVIDYEIYNNNDELVDTPFTKQVNDLYRAQCKYYMKIIDMCQEIIDSGSKYTANVDYLYKRAQEMVDTNKKWRDNDNSFGNLVVKIIVESKCKLKEGSKITGRCGNKSVISVVRKDEDMPFTEDGRRIDLILNLNAVINRTTAFAQYELLMNSIQFQVRRKMSNMRRLADKEKLFFQAYAAMSEANYDAIKNLYDAMDTKGKKEFIQTVIEDGIYMEQEPMWQKEPLFDRLRRFMHENKWIEPDNIYTMRYGRPVRSLFKTYVGEMYIMKLKQSDKRGYAARSTGAIDTKGLGTRSHSSHSHDTITNNKPVHFGEQETINFLIGMYPIELVLVHALLRTSTDGRKDLVMRNMTDPKPGSSYFKIPKKYTSLIGQIAHVYFKSLGIKIEFKDESEKVVALDNKVSKMHKIHDRDYLATDLEAHTLLAVFDIMRIISVREMRPIPKEEMRELVIKHLSKDKKTYGIRDISCIDKFNVV